MINLEDIKLKPKHLTEYSCDVCNKTILYDDTIMLMQGAWDGYFCAKGDCLLVQAKRWAEEVSK